jgi:hypothetical protein
MSPFDYNDHTMLTATTNYSALLFSEKCENYITDKGWIWFINTQKKEQGEMQTTCLCSLVHNPLTSISLIHNSHLVAMLNRFNVQQLDTRNLVVIAR